MVWDKTKPDGSLAVSVGDDHIRLNNEHLEDALSREHEFPGTIATTSGRHKFPVVADRATMLGLVGQIDGMIVGRTDLNAIFQLQASAWVMQHGTGYMDAAGKAALTAADLGNGYMVYESDTGILWVYETAGPSWVQVAPGVGYTFQNPATVSQQGLTTDFDNPDLVIGMDRTITPPNDGLAYDIIVRAKIPCRSTSGDLIMFWLMEDIDGAGDVEKDRAMMIVSAGNVYGDVSMLWVNPAATNDKTHQYTILGAREHATNTLVNPAYTIPYAAPAAETFYAKMTVSLTGRRT